MGELRKISIDQLKLRLNNLVETPPRKQSEAFDLTSPFLEAAAVMVFYDPDKINPVAIQTKMTDAERNQYLFELFSVSRVVIDINAPSISKDDREQDVQLERVSYTLKDDVRRAVLSSLKKNGRLSLALVANQASVTNNSTPLQVLFTYALRNANLDLNNLSVPDLNAALKICDWLNSETGFPDMPRRADIRRRLQVAELLTSFKHLTGKYHNGKFVEHFRGRQKELATLRKFVGVAPPQGTYEALSRKVETFFEMKKAPLLIHGIGGVGKSTLLAKFLLQHIEAHQNDRFPFVYLDFDRPNLLPDRPETLLIEAARQLSIQFSDLPDFHVLADEYYTKWKMAFYEKVKSTSTEVSLKSGSELLDLRVKRNELLKSFSNLLTQLTEKMKKPFLVVLDTFEEVQYRGESAVIALYDLLKTIQNDYAQLRIVAVGRAQVSQITTEEMYLENLDMEAAAGFLTAHGIHDENMVNKIVKKYGGNPLTLKLAVDLYHDDGMESLDAVKATKKSFGFIERRLPEAEIQGVLYTRILRHIHNEDVYKLAHPGLVLRFLTPELIWQVLAKPCKLTITDLTTAKTLFDEMCREVSLVTKVGPDKVRHIPTIRKVMLRMIEKSQPRLVRKIKQEAIKYYANKIDLESRAEEIYYRLSLGGKRSILDRRWVDGVEKFLINSADELPAKAQAYLSARSGFELFDHKMWEKVSMADQERRLTRQMADFLNAGMPDKALEALTKGRFNSVNAVVRLLEIRALTVMEKLDEAMEKGIELLEEKNNELNPTIRRELLKNVTALYNKGIKIGATRAVYDEIVSMAKKTEDIAARENFKFKL